jgi:hypothetical protein
MRAQAQAQKSFIDISAEQKEGKMVSLMNIEVEHCAAVIAAAFLNPSKPN